MKPIVVVGHAALDRLYRIGAFPEKPVKVRALEHIEAGGGMAANAAATIAHLGGPVALWSRVGDDDNGERILRLLTADGVDVSHVRRVAHARSSTSAILVDAEGERLIVGERDHGMSNDAAWLPLEDIDGAAAVLSDLRWIEATRAVLSRARAAGVASVIDADLGGGTHLDEFVRACDYAIFSRPALDNFLPGQAPAEALRRILALGPRHAGVTCGRQGYFWCNAAGQQGHQPAFKVVAVDTTGAGDAFHGAFTWAIARGAADAEAARIAAAVAAMMCRRLGARAGLPREADLAAFLAMAETAGGAGSLP